MSGHSHWSTIKRQKQSGDAKKSKLFAKLSKALTVAVREGSGNTDPNTNPRLRLAMEQARLANMSKDSIQRAIRKSGTMGGKAGLEPVVFGGFILGNTALFIEGVTDNRRRTTSQIKNILEAKGGTLASPESVNPYFERVGVVVIPKDGRNEEQCLELALEVEAEDFVLRGEHLRLITPAHKISLVKDKLSTKGIEVLRDTLELKPRTIKPITGAKDRNLISQVIKLLEEHDDVTKVYTNANLEMAR